MLIGKRDVGDDALWPPDSRPSDRSVLPDASLALRSKLAGPLAVVFLRFARMVLLVPGATIRKWLQPLATLVAQLQDLPRPVHGLVCGATAKPHLAHSRSLYGQRAEEPAVNRPIQGRRLANSGLVDGGGPEGIKATGVNPI